MLAITQIKSYIPEYKICNYDRKDKFQIDDYFIKEKIGFENLALKDKNEKATDLCVKAFEKLENINKDEIECIIFVSQNPDYKIPHSSAMLHNKLKLSQKCACFDIGLGCSGYVYALANIFAFMQYNHFTKALLFTCDPYSQIIDADDKNTSLLFGDAASVSYISEEGLYAPKAFKFGTDSSGYKAIFCEKDNLQMDGRAVFNFAASIIPKEIETLLQSCKLEKSQIDKFLLHQGSKYIIDTIAKRLKIEPSKIPFLANSYGNTISSSIPILLEQELKNSQSKYLLLCGFGTGLSWATCILKQSNLKEKQ